MLLFVVSLASHARESSTVLRATAPPSSAEGDILRRTKRWACISSCGACCYLQPDEREGLDDWLSHEDRLLYESMVAEDGWCRHFDKTNRLCTIYEDRPGFCRVSDENFADMYEFDTDVDTFCTACCREHIGDVYGKQSDEMRRFNQEIKRIRRTNR